MGDKKGAIASATAAHPPKDEEMFHPRPNQSEKIPLNKQAVAINNAS